MKLSRREGERVMHTIREVMAVRYRELYGTTLGDPRSVVRVDLGSGATGRGVVMYFCNLPVGRRLPLRAYVAGFTVKNGVPINYIEAIGLCEWIEVGFNTFYTYRHGETAWIYAQTLRLLRQLHGTNAISVYPYQIGDGNEEAIASGAFWFYRKMGFRSMDPALEKLAEAEEKKVRANPKYRTSAATLRRLSKANVVYELPEAQRGAWDNFSMRNIGLAVQKRMARDFDADAEAMRKAAVKRLAHTIKVDPKKLKPQAQTAFADFATVLSLVPELDRWSAEEKDTLRDIIIDKAGRTELRYQGMLQKHHRLRTAILKLGSQKL